MSRVDFIVDGDMVAHAHQDDPESVRISMNGGKTYLSPESYEHIVVEVETNGRGPVVHVREDESAPEP